MKNFKLNFILIFLFGNLFQFNQLQAQVGFSKEYQINPSTNAIESTAVGLCADGGIAVSYFKFGEGSSFLLKTDSNGVILWIQEFKIIPFAGFDEVESFDMIATPDSGFLYSFFILHPVLSGYKRSVILKLDKFGNVQHSTATDIGSFGTITHLIPFHYYNNSTQITTSLVIEFDYDGFGNICCQHQALVQMDSSLNIILQNEITNSGVGIIGYGNQTATEIYNNTIHIGNFVTTKDFSPIPGSQLILLGLTGNIIWQKYINLVQTRAATQLNNHIYILCETYTNKHLHLIKLDLQGNIISTKVFNNSKRILPYKIVPSPNSTLYVSGIKANQNISPSTFNSVIMELDTIGNVLQAYNSLDSTDIQSSFIDSNQGIFLFTKKISGNYFAFQVDKVFLNGNSCNMVPLSIASYDTLITDTASFANINTYNMNMLQPSFTTDSTFHLNTITNCAPLTIIDHSFLNIDLQIYPNPVNDILHVGLDNRYNKPLQIQVTDILGRTVHENQFFDSDYELEVSDMKQGIYFLTVSSKDFFENRKFVVQ